MLSKESRKGTARRNSNLNYRPRTLFPVSYTQAKIISLNPWLGAGEKSNVSSHFRGSLTTHGLYFKKKHIALNTKFSIYGNTHNLCGLKGQMLL